MEQLYVMIIDEGERYAEVSREVTDRHTEYIDRLDKDGSLALYGPLTGHPGVVGMVMLKALSHEEAEALCRAEPLVAGGYATYRLRAL